MKKTSRYRHIVSSPWDGVRDPVSRGEEGEHDVSFSSFRVSTEIHASLQLGGILTYGACIVSSQGEVEVKGK